MTTVFIVVGVWAGVLEDLHAYIDIAEARAKRDELLEPYGLTEDDKPDNQHSQECRWNDENEVHLHSVELQ